MEQPNVVSTAVQATRADLERHIAAVAPQVRRPVEGIFGADSVSWKINRESALFLGAGRAALLQLAHPWVAAALDQHSSLLAKPIARFHNTFRVVFTMIFGTSDQAFTSARALFQMHTRITGEVPEKVRWLRKRLALRSAECTRVEVGLRDFDRERGDCLSMRIAAPPQRRTRAILCRVEDPGRPVRLASPRATRRLERLRGIRRGNVQFRCAWRERPRTIHGSANHVRFRLASPRASLVPGPHNGVSARAVSPGTSIRL